MSFTARCLAVLVCCFVQFIAARFSPSAEAAATQSSLTVIKSLPYSEEAGDARRSLDLYLPAKSNAKPPLLIFVHGGFWLLPDDEYRIGASLAENLVKDGVAVALARYRLAPAHRHPVQAQDVASAVARLVRDADKYGIDPKRIFLSGHSAGGHLASLIALDKTYLAEAKLPGDIIAGVISFSGLYDLMPAWNVSSNQKVATDKTFGNDPAVRKRASPVQHARRDAPRFLILNAFADFPGFALDARRFADALRAAGAKETHQHMFKGVDHFGIVKLDDENNAIRRTILGFMGVFRNGCVYCHNFRGIGARSHHVHALTGKPHGGFALALEDYPPEVWRDFVFNQLEVAKKMGATPNIVQENAGQALFEMVNKARAQALAK